MGRLVWIIDEEWTDYDVETRMLHEWDPDCDIRMSGYDYEKDLEDFGHRADLILAQVYAPIPRSAIEQLDRCRGIALFGGGYDRVDVAAAAEHGIPVTNVHGYCAEDLADYVLSAIFQWNKPLGGYGHAIANGIWGAPAIPVPRHRISRSTLLVVGCGRIGLTVAKRAGMLGMRIIGYDPHRGEDELAAHGVERVDLHEGLAQADVISVNARLCDETVGLLGEREFACCKPGSLLVNTARGGVLDEGALIRAVRDGRPSSAVLDVIANEPPHGDEAVLHCDGITVTPHISYISIESFAELRTRTIRNGIDMVEGRHPDDVVNM